MKIVNQQDAMDCGPACLAMVAGYYGQQIDREYLRVTCALGKEGVSLLGTVGLQKKSVSKL